MENIKLYLEDWLYNAGVVGFYNILENAGDEIILKEDYLEFKPNVLENFEEKYFNYFIEKYESIISLNKILDFEEFILKHEENDFKDFDKKELEKLDKYIRETVKKQIKSNSYKAAYKLINNNKNILDLEKELKGIKLKKKEEIVDILPEINKRFELLKEIFEYLKEDESKKYIGGKNIMYTIIKNGWNGVCFLNPQTKEKNMYIDYLNYFINPTIEYIKTDKSKFKYNCFLCNEPLANLDDTLGFLNEIGFDVSRKSSHVWDFQNDVSICPICKIIYSCIPAGITYLYDKGIFVNDNNNMKSIININNKIYMEIYKNKEESKKLTYKALVKAVNKEDNNKSKYELADIQVVRYENESYKFNILSKQSLNMMKNSEKNLNRLINTGFKEINTYFNIYELVVERILNGQNMFTLIQKLLYYKLSQPKDSYYNCYHILEILKINAKFLQEVGVMENQDKDIVKRGNAAGYYLREKYRNKGAIDKLGGISYKLLNALKTNNSNSFMDTVLNCYLYAKEQVPKIILDTLKTEEEFKTIGYAFVAGLIEGKKDENGGNKND